MTHKEIYYHLVKKENANGLGQLLEKQGIFEKFKVERLEIQSQNDFPYILVQVRSKDLYAAMFIGIFTDIRPLFPNYPDEFYYLPLIFFCPYYPEKFQKLINREFSIRHEVLHIKDILDLVEQEPGYLTKVRQYNVNNEDLQLDDLEKSMDLEIFKVFYLEPRALAQDFANGENTLYMELGEKILQYHCQTSEEYVQLKINDYITKIRILYLQKFPAKKFRIENGLKNFTNKYGKDIYGEDAYDNMLHLGSVHLKKLMSSFLNFKPAPSGNQ
ncbi:MAG: hypothetical protein JSV88_01425 [Candidatus Aminicenantes bacterium]|nr:MAG: hypothetical protein JSV88_01425 [Candidatus Aminicenantes bacterium]